MRIWGVLTVVVLALVGAASAQAAQRYVSPGGSGESCAQSAPCDLSTGVTKATAGDEVIVGQGTYDVPSSIVLPNSAAGASVHGDLSGAMPKIVSTVAVPLYSQATAVTFSYLEISVTGPNPVAGYCSNQDTMERMRFSAEGTGAVGIRLSARCVLRNSLVRVNGKEAVGVAGENFIAPMGSEAVLSSTVIATGEESRGLTATCILCFTGSEELEVTNTIAFGEASDLEAVEFEGPARIVVGHSNFDKASSTIQGAIVDAGGNQSAAPEYVSAASGDYSETGGSPTVGAGLVDSRVGPLDLAGNPRVVDGKVDIGAFEFQPSPGDLTSLSLRPSKFRPADSSEAIASAKKKPKKKAPIGTTVSYGLSAKSTIAFSVERKTVGRKSGGKCVKQTKANKKKKKCSLFKPRGSFSLGAPGSGSFRFSGRLDGKKLKAGVYRLLAGAGGVSKTVPFTILK